MQYIVISVNVGGHTGIWNYPLDNCKPQFVREFRNQMLNVLGTHATPGSCKSPMQIIMAETHDRNTPILEEGALVIERIYTNKHDIRYLGTLLSDLIGEPDFVVSLPRFHGRKSTLRMTIEMLLPNKKSEVRA